MRPGKTTIRGGLRSLPLALGLLVPPACVDANVSDVARVVTPEQFVSTSFEACETGPALNPSPVSVDQAAFAALLHGVWVGTRTARDGMSVEPDLVPGREPPSHYVLIFDTQAGEAFTFEELGHSIPGNAFAELLPAAPERGPRFVTFFCGSKTMGAFRDEFVKVSDDPGAGLRALGEVTGVAVSQSTISQAWRDLQEVDFFTRRRGDAHITAALNTLSARNVLSQDGTRQDVRWDMVGEFRGSPERLGVEQPLSGVSGGLFQGVTVGDETYLVNGEIHVPCYGPPKPDPVSHTQGGGSSAAVVPSPRRDEGASNSVMRDVAYTKIVIGPFR